MNFRVKYPRRKTIRTVANSVQVATEVRIVLTKQRKIKLIKSRWKRDEERV